MRVLLLLIFSLLINVRANAVIDSVQWASDKALAFSVNNQWDSAAHYYEISADLRLTGGDITAFLQARLQHVSALQMQKKYLEAEQLLELTGNNYLEQITSKELATDYYYKLTNAYGYQGKYFQAYQAAKKNLQFLNGQEIQSGEMYSSTISGLASLSRILGFYDEGLFYANQTLKLATDSLDKSHAYNYVGLIHKRLGNKNAALDNLQKCLSLREQYNPLWAPYVIINIAELYHSLGDADSALYWVDQGLALSSKLYGSEKQLNYALLINKTFILHDLGKTEEAREINIKAYELLTKLNPPNKFSRFYPKHIESALELGLYDFGKKLLIELEKSLEENPSISTLAELNNNFGKYYLTTGNLDSALYFYSKTIQSFEDTRDSLSNVAIPVSQSLLYQYAQLKRLEILQRFYKESGNIDYLHLAIESHDVLIEDIVSKKYEHVSLSGASNFFRQKNQYLDLLLNLTTELSKVNSSKDYLNNISQIMELKRLNTFKKEFAFQQNYAISGVSDSIMIKRRNLQAQIHELVSSYNNLTPTKKESLLLLQRELEDIHLQIKDGNPNFHKTIISQNTDVSDIESKLRPNEALVQFSFSKEQLFVLVSKSKGSEVFVTDWNDEKDRDLNDLIEAVKTNTSNYEALASAVLKNIDWDQLALENSPIIQIIADKRLTLLPFEILKKDNRYLIEKHQFVYKLSLTNFKSGNSSSTNSFLGFAPFTTQGNAAKLMPNEDAPISRTNTALLPATEREIKGIQKIWPGTIFLGEEATESIFKKEVSNARIIHLATHSILDNDNPLNSIIMFSNTPQGEDDGFLHTYELLQMNLNADLVTLSACNTGVGKYYEGEGMISLASGFNIAGVDNIVMSLWPVPDNTTAYIMKQFYFHLQKDFDVPQALAQAKLDYLNASDSQLSHPYYWAGFIATTDGWSNPTATEINSYLIIVALVLLFFLLLAGNKFRKKQTTIG